jgi:hypothetical protein
MKSAISRRKSVIFTRELWFLLTRVWFLHEDCLFQTQDCGCYTLNMILASTSVITTHTNVISTRKVWFWPSRVWFPHARFNFQALWLSQARYYDTQKCNNNTLECYLYTKSAISRYMSMIYTRTSMILTRSVWLWHAAYDAGDFYTHACDFKRLSGEILYQNLDKNLSSTHAC